MNKASLSEGDSKVAVSDNPIRDFNDITLFFQDNTFYFFKFRK